MARIPGASGVTNTPVSSSTGRGLQVNVPAGASTGIISARFGLCDSSPEISGASSASPLFALSFAIAFLAALGVSSARLSAFFFMRRSFIVPIGFTSARSPASRTASSSGAVRPQGPMLWMRVCSSCVSTMRFTRRSSVRYPLT